MNIDNIGDNLLRTNNNNICNISVPYLSERKILQEWKSLKNSYPSPRCGAARKYFNSALNNPGKNRYPDVLPFESTRVILSKNQKNKSDYINANFICTCGSNRPNFISCQAPLPHTFNDFWRMVWEYDIPVIVMLTRLMERRRVKAHCYWPSSVGEVEQFNDISVELVEQQIENKLNIRKFKLTCDNSSREILHIHYTEWPDYGVPSSGELIQQVISRMELARDEYRVKNNLTVNPIIAIHCSAGIGRAGTFIAISSFKSMCELGNIAGVPSIKKIVENLRQQRMGMVQTKEQYSFIYTAAYTLCPEEYNMPSPLHSSSDSELSSSYDHPSPVPSPKTLSLSQNSVPLPLNVSTNSLPTIPSRVGESSGIWQTRNVITSCPLSSSSATLITLPCTTPVN